MPGARWTKKELRELRRQLRSRSIEDVELPGRSEHAVRRQASRMELIEQRPGRFKWPRRQVDKLVELAKQGLTVSEIHRFELLGDPPRSLWAIRKMWGRLKLADPQRRRRMQRRKVWAPGEKTRFDQFLRRHSGSMTPEQIGKQWGVARSTVARRQTELGIKRSRAEVLEMPYSREKRDRARQRLRRRNLEYWRRRRQEAQREMEELARQLRRRRGDIDEQQCVDCGRTWPRRSEFFHATEKQISIGTSRYFKHRCILCENQRRRRRSKRRQ